MVLHDNINGMKDMDLVSQMVDSSKNLIYHEIHLKDNLSSLMVN